MLDCVTVTLVNRVPNSVTVSTGVSGGGTWGTISGTITDQSDLVTYVADEIASIPAPSTPTLDSVTAQGSTTTNAISVGGLTASSLVYPSTDGTTGQIIQTDGAGTLSFVDAPNDAAWGNISGTLSTQTDLQTALDAKEDESNKSTTTTLGTSNTLYPTQNAVKTYVDTEVSNVNVGVTELNGLTGDLDLVAGSNVTITPSGSTITIASTGGGGGSQDLQSVTDVGNTTTNSVKIGSSASPAVTLDVDGQVHLGPQTALGFPSFDIAASGRTTIRSSAPVLSIRNQSNGAGYLDMGNGTLNGVTSINSASVLLFSSTNVRFGGDTGARVNIVGQNSSSQYVLGLKQGVGGSTTLLSAQNSSGAQVIGITAEGGFYVNDSTLVKRYIFDHDYAPSPADGLSVGLEFRTENKSGVLLTFGYIDIVNDDRNAEESSMRFSVGELNPNEVMRLQDDGNVGVNFTAPTSSMHIDGTAMNQLRLNTSGGPTSNTDTSGEIGDIAYDANYIYIKTSNGWGRAALDFSF